MRNETLNNDFTSTDKKKRIIGEDFIPTQATIGTEFKFRNINVDENKIQIQIWDTCKKIYI
jgi:GTPase SAR1 family protein